MFCLCGPSHPLTPPPPPPLHHSPSPQYFLTFPSVYAHSLLIGTLRMEMGDTAHIVCPKTGYSAEIDFHMKVGRWPGVAFFLHAHTP